MARQVVNLEVERKMKHILKRTAGNIGVIADLRERALEAFLEKLKAQEGANLLRVAIFGSVARGDSRLDSDIDLFVLVKNGTREELRDRIVDLATDTNLEEGDCKVYIAPFIRTLEQYENRKKAETTVLLNIDRNGVVLYDAV